MKEIDDELMGDRIGYKLEQLMELAGLSVAQAIYHATKTEENWKGVKKILTVSGPGSIIYFLK